MSSAGPTVGNEMKPKYLTVIEHIQEHYISKGCSPDGLLPSEPKLARELGISRFPVHQAYKILEQRGAVSRTPGVGTFVKGFEPEKTAIPQKDQRLIGIACCTGSLHPELLKGIQDILTPKGFLLVTVPTGPASDNDLVKRVLSMGLTRLLLIPGVNFHPGDDPCLTAVQKLSAAGVAVVIVERPLPGFDGCQVIVDNAGGTEMATSWMLRNNCPTPAYFGKIDYIVGYERYLGYENALRRANLTMDPDLVHLDRSGIHFLAKLDYLIENGMDKVLNRYPDCRAFVTFGAVCAHRLYRYLCRNDLLHPDLLIAGYDPVMAYDSSLSDFYITLERPLLEIGRAAADAMLACLQNKAPKNSLFVKHLMPDMSTVNCGRPTLSDCVLNGI